MPTLPTGTVTFLFTDIEGSTRLLQRLGATYARVLGEHQELLRAACAAHDGVEVDTQGDAFFVVFASAPQAAAAAVAATRALAAHEWPEGAVLRVRMGLHTGAPQLAGDHYVGLDVHRAARIAAAGHGGQILLSRTTRDLAEHDLPAGTTLRDLGPHRLKDLQHTEHLYQFVLPDLPNDFLPLKTLDVHQHNLPLQPTPLLGREQQVAALTKLLRRDDARLVTLIGPGGVGKTRLAVQVAAELIDVFEDGVWYVRLSRLVDPTLVVPTIAETLGLKEAGSQPIAELLRAYLAEKRLLLLLDNFEQVVGAAPEVAALLAVTPGAKVLVTSRIPLRLRGEKAYAVPPLPLIAPGQRPPLERITHYAALALFIERAHDAKAEFAVTAFNAPIIAEICSRLDGLPLAIELAAARVRLLPPEALLARLSSRLKLLTGGARDAEERQRTMRATLVWSEDLLAPSERVLFRRLAVFVGGGTLEAIEMVCAAPAGTAPLEVDALDGLGELVEQSLVQQREEGGEARFGMLHVVREYALERLDASGEAQALRRAHVAAMVALAERAEPELTGPKQAAWIDRIDREYDNLRAAVGWAREGGEAEIGLRLMAPLWRFWEWRGHLREGRAWVEELLALAEPTDEDTDRAHAVPARLCARALFVVGELAIWQGDFAAAEPSLDRATALARAEGDRRTAGHALNRLGMVAAYQGDFERATALYTESLALMRKAGDQWGIAMALNNLADSAYRKGDSERAAAAFTESLTLARQAGDLGTIALSLTNLSMVARGRGELTKAAALAREALTGDWELGDPRRCAEDLEQVATTAGAAGHGARAARLLGVAAALRETLGAPQPLSEREDTEQAVAGARTALGEDAWTAAFVAGRALSLELAIAEALGEEGEGPGG